MKRLILGIGFLASLVTQAHADGTIDTLSAGGALTGTEMIPMFQTANPAVATTPSAIATYYNPLTATLTNKTINCSNNTCTNVSLTTGVTGILPIANGGTATATPGLVAGTNITITGSWPNQTINASSSGSVTTTGSPATGNLTKFSGATSITNGDLTGDVTTSGALATTIANNAVTTAKILNGAVTYGKMQNGASTGLLCVNNGSSPTECAVGSGLTLSSNTLSVVPPAGSTGFGVDTGAGKQTLNTTGAINNSARDVVLGTPGGTAWSSGIVTLPAISSVSNDTCVRISDAGGMVSGSATVTIAANPGDSVNNGLVGGNTGAYSTPNLSVWACVVATHNWNISVATIVPTPTAGQMLQLGTGPNLSWSATPVLGSSGVVGTLGFGNATSGIVTLGTVTGALGTVTASLPANTGTIAELNLAQTWTAAQTFGTNLGSENDQSGTTYTLVANDCGKTVAFSNSSAVTVTIPASIVPAAGTTCQIAIRQDGTGQVAVNGSAVTPATLVSAHGYTKTFGQNATIGLQLTTISSVTSAVLTGDGA